MRGAGQPLKFLVVVLLGWTGARAAMLWPGAPLAAPAEATAAPGLATPNAAAPLLALGQPLRPRPPRAAASVGAVPPMASVVLPSARRAVVAADSWIGLLRCQGR
jgi:hypothetical protein